MADDEAISEIASRFGFAFLLAACFSLLAVFPAALSAQPEETPEERRARWDRGPQTIDVSGYPPEMQTRYELFSEKCSKCHNLARPINAEFAPEDWSGYLDRMMRKRGSGIAKKDKQAIYEFLVHDTRVRKPRLAPENGPGKVK